MKREKTVKIKDGRIRLFDVDGSLLDSAAPNKSSFGKFLEFWNTKYNVLPVKKKGKK